jgi:hypothetical protein
VPSSFQDRGNSKAQSRAEVCLGGGRRQTCLDSCIVKHGEQGTKEERILALQREKTKDSKSKQLEQVDVVDEAS